MGFKCPPVMRSYKNILDDPNYLEYYDFGKRFLNDPYIIKTVGKSYFEASKSPKRTDIINFLLSLRQSETHYLEIGVRNPEDNFNHIKASNKYGVDPGIEFKSNPVDFRMTSDIFFKKLFKNEVLSNNIKFDVIFIDGLHFAEQVDRDITNALNCIKEDGFIVLHDCNPPTEWHAREISSYCNPVGGYWNGTTWKAFFKWRCNPSVRTCCIDTDWGVGIISRKHEIGRNVEPENQFFEFNIFDNNRKNNLNLVDFETFKRIVVKFESRDNVTKWM